MNAPPAPDQDNPKHLAFTNGGRNEIWKRGRTLVVVPTLNEQYPPQLKEAIVRRRATLLSGQCPCGAQFAPQAPDPIRDNETVILHATDCPAQDAEHLFDKWIATCHEEDQP